MGGIKKNGRLRRHCRHGKLHVLDSSGRSVYRCICSVFQDPGGRSGHSPCLGARRAGLGAQISRLGTCGAGLDALVPRLGAWLVLGLGSRPTLALRHDLDSLARRIADIQWCDQYFCLGRLGHTKGHGQSQAQDPCSLKHCLSPCIVDFRTLKYTMLLPAES